MSDFACYLTSESLLHLRGQKIPEFLQGQLSCDMRTLDSKRAVSGAFCNVKGRVISDVTVVWVDAQHCLLRLRASVAAAVADTLRRYAQFSRISVQPDDRERAILGVYCAAPPWDPGRQTPAGKSDQIHKAALSPVDSLHNGTILRLQRIEGLSEYLLVHEDGRAALDTIHDDLPAGDERAFQSRILAAGHYAIEKEDMEVFTPQTLNYDRRGLVAFDKGCYTGQEVIARLHYKGRAKRRLQVFFLSAGAMPPGGEELRNRDGATVGRVLRRLGCDDGSSILAVELPADLLGERLALDEGTQLRPIATL